MKFLGRSQHSAFEIRRSQGSESGAPLAAGAKLQCPARGLRQLRSGRASGLTLIELIVAITILMILTTAAIPVARVSIQRTKERELRRALWEMRDAIDRYKDAADRGAFQVKVGTEGYPPDLQTLVD